jgi:hypothetical protein
VQLSRGIKQLAARVGPAIPRPAGRLPYATSFSFLDALLTLAFGPGEARAWARNSYLTESFIPGVSDLDITIWLRRDPGAKAWSKLRTILKGSRAIFPWLSEANVYVAADARELAPLFNPFELARDPELGKKLGPIAPILSSRVHTAAFLARMLERDAEGLKTRPHARAGKWRIHLSETDCPPPPAECIPLADGLRDHILDCLFELVSSPYSPDRKLERASFQSAVVAHLDRAALGEEPDYRQGSSPWLYALFTHRYCGTDPVPELPLRLAETALANLAWECWGLYSQLYAMAGDAGLPAHLERLKMAAKGLEGRSELAAALGPVRAGLERLTESLRGR